MKNCYLDLCNCIAYAIKAGVKEIKLEDISPYAVIDTSGDASAKKWNQFLLGSKFKKIVKENPHIVFTTDIWYRNKKGTILDRKIQL